MAAKKLTNHQINVYFEKLNEYGEDGLYIKSMNAGLMRFAQNVKHPEIELLELSDLFFNAAKNNNKDEILFTIGKILRRAAHGLYRIIAQNKKNFISDARILREVK